MLAAITNEERTPCFIKTVGTNAPWTIQFLSVSKNGDIDFFPADDSQGVAIQGLIDDEELAVHPFPTRHFDKIYKTIGSPM